MVVACRAPRSVVRKEVDAKVARRMRLQSSPGNDNEMEHGIHNNHHSSQTTPEALCSTPCGTSLRLRVARGVGWSPSERVWTVNPSLAIFF